MKNKFLIAALFLGWLMPVWAMAQGDELQSTGNSYHNAASAINPSDVVVVGSVKAIVSKHALGTPAGAYLLLNSTQGLAYVHLGPYLTNDVRASLTNAQLVQVTGIPKAINGKNYLLARQIVFSGRQVNIRNEHGFLLRAEVPASFRVHKGQSELNGGAL